MSMRLALAMIALTSAGCDALFNLDHVPEPDDARRADSPVGNDVLLPADTFFSDGSDGAISFVQGSDFTATSASVLGVSFPGVETMGDVNVVFIGWTSSTSMVIAVSDLQGNVYGAQTPSTFAGGLGEIAYFAKVGLTGTNRITVQFNETAGNVDIRVAEYRGVAKVDGVASNAGTGQMATTGPVNTTGQHTIVVAGFMVSGAVTLPGATCTSRTVTNAGNFLEDCERFSPSQAEATVTQSQTGAYIGQAIALAP